MALLRAKQQLRGGCMRATQVVRSTSHDVNVDVSGGVAIDITKEHTQPRVSVDDLSVDDLHAENRRLQEEVERLQQVVHESPQ